MVEFARVRASFDRTLLLISSIIFVGSIGFFLVSHAGFASVMIDFIIANIERR